eukprot:9455439-Ditylum_brightwellii.AAC.2
MRMTQKTMAPSTIPSTMLRTQKIMTHHQVRMMGKTNMTMHSTRTTMNQMVEMGAVAGLPKRKTISPQECNGTVKKLWKHLCQAMWKRHQGWRSPPPRDRCMG